MGALLEDCLEIAFSASVKGFSNSELMHTNILKNVTGSIQKILINKDLQSDVHRTIREFLSDENRVFMKSLKNVLST